MSPAAPSHAAVDAAPAELSPAERRAVARALAEGQMAMLTELAEIGMEIARAAGRLAVAAPEGEGRSGGATAHDRCDPGLTFARAARAVRTTIAVQARLSKDLEALDKAEASDRTNREYARKNRIHRLVKDAIAAEPDADECEFKQLSWAAWERLTDPDEYGDLMDRPVGEVVASICRDLGVSVDWDDGGGEDAEEAPRDETLSAQAPPPIPLGSGGGGPRSGGGGFGALGPAAAPQGPHPGLRPYFPHSQAGSGEEQKALGQRRDASP